MGRVFVIDDDPAMRGTIRKILMREGHEVREARSSGKGPDLFRGERADMVVTDLDMPAQEGVAAIVDLCDGTPGARVVGISGGATSGAEAELPGILPYDRVSPKPFTVDQLRHAVAVLLS